MRRSIDSLRARKRTSDRPCNGLTVTALVAEMHDEIVVWQCLLDVRVGPLRF